jgi:hypothetical protein
MQRIEQYSYANNKHGNKRPSSECIKYLIQEKSPWSNKNSKRTVYPKTKWSSEDTQWDTWKGKTG